MHHHHATCTLVINNFGEHDFLSWPLVKRTSAVRFVPVSVTAGFENVSGTVLCRFEMDADDATLDGIFMDCLV